VTGASARPNRAAMLTNIDALIPLLGAAQLFSKLAV
jgi:hypothetical protein